MLTLPLMLFIVLIELCVGQYTVMYLLDMRHAVKRSFLVLYAFIYLFLAGLTCLFQQGFSSPDLLNTFQLLDHGWTSSLSLPVLLFMLLLLPYILFLLLDRNAGIANEGTQAADQQRPVTVIFLLRMISGGLAVLAGLGTLFVVGMIYRPLGGAGIGSILVIAGFFAAALALGGVMTAMWLGHWYLVTPAMTEKPLLLSTTLVLIGVLCEVMFFLGAGASIAPVGATGAPPSTPLVSASPSVTGSHPAAVTVKPADVPTVTPLDSGAIGWLRIVVGFAIPLILGALTWKLVRDRSFQSATGMLYLIVVCTLAGEILARGLFLTSLY